MADTVVYMFGTSGAVPIKATDSGDGSLLLAATKTNGPGVVVYLDGLRGPTPIKAVANGDGTYSLLVYEVG